MAFSFVNVEKVGACFSTVIARPVLSQIDSLVAQIVDDAFGQLPRLIHQFQISRNRDVGGRAGRIDGERSPVLALWPIGRLDTIVKWELVACIVV